VLKAYADEHVRSAIVQALRQRGMDVATVQQRQGESTDDAEVLAEALRGSRILLTNDADFLKLAAQCAAKGVLFAPIFFWPQQSHPRVGDLVRRIIREASGGTYTAICSQVHFF
jgi:hypothetical protein